MKLYFSNQDRNNFLLMLSFWSFIEMLIERASCYDKLEMKYLRTAKSYLLKFNELVLNRTEDKFKSQILRQLNASKIGIIPKCSSMEVGTSLDVNEEEYYKLCDLAARGCRGCKRCYKECETYDLFMRLHVPVGNTIETDDCPYCF